MRAGTSRDTQGREDISAPNAIPGAEVEAELKRILGSSVFCSAARHSRFLSFVVSKALTGEQGGLKEYLIGLEVFDRKADFDPSTDPIVRSEARRLRIRLAEYYQGPGKLDPIVVELPKGTYVPVFSRNQIQSVTDAPGESADYRPPSTQPQTAIHEQRNTRMRRRWLAALAVLVVAGIVAGYFLFPKPAELTDKDSVVLGDFENKTGDPVFDDTLKQGLSVQLEQSPFLSLVSDSRVNQTLKLMGHAVGNRLTSDIAREVCQRTASTAVLSGSIAALGTQYVIGLRAVNCNTGDVLAETQALANGKEKVLGALDRAATALRHKLGESLSSVHRYSTPLMEATTPSLDALKAYSLGRKINAEKGDMAALAFYQRAADLDPNFAMAYRAMASLYENQEEPERAAQNARKAYELRTRTSERERFSIETTYYVTVTGELEKAAQTYDLWQQTYPRDGAAFRDPAIISASLGRLDRALQESLSMVHADPDDVVSYFDLGLCYLYLNRFADAEAVYKKAGQDPQTRDYLIEPRYVLAFVTGDQAEMARQVAAAAEKPGIEDRLYFEEATTEAWYGKMRSARELTQRAMDSAEHADAKEAAAMYQAMLALAEVEVGSTEQGRSDARAALKLAPNRDAQAMAALALARSGDITAAQKVADELDQRFPLNTIVQRYSLPTIRAAIALQRNDPNEAVELLRGTSAIELGDSGNLLPVYVRGQAYLMLHDGKAAATEFHKFSEHRGLIANFILGALARLELGRAYILEAAFDSTARDDARVAYQDFLNLWKDADPDIPIHKQARAEYERLQ